MEKSHRLSASVAEGDKNKPHFKFMTMDQKIADLNTFF